jgi:hypothetical protein
MILGNTASLVEYKNKKIGDYGVTLDTTQGNGFFGIKVSGVEQAVCERLQDQWLSNAVKTELGGTALADATCAEENNDITYVFNEALNASAVAGEGNGDSGSCPEGTSTSGAGGYAMTLESGNMCYCENLNTIYNGTTCEVKADNDNTCSSFADCNAGEYCSLDYCECDVIPTSGTCEASSTWFYTYKGFLYQQGFVSWWAAKDICAARGMQMVSLSDLGCNREGCPPADETNPPLWQELGDNLIRQYVWMTDLYEENNPNSCSTFVVDLESGYVGTEPRTSDNGGSNILCR